jgi:hypothetical protein
MIYEGERRVFMVSAASHPAVSLSRCKVISLICGKSFKYCIRAAGGVLSDIFFFLTQRRHYCLDCFLNDSIALAMISSLSVDCHSSQKSIVALLGFIEEVFIFMQLGSNDASPTTKASPTSKTGNKSENSPKLSGNNLFITAWSSAFVNLIAIK